MALPPKADMCVALANVCFGPKADIGHSFDHLVGGIQDVEHTEGDGAEMFKAVCKLGLEEMVSKKLNAPYRSGPSKTWIKVKNPKAPAATRVIDGTFDVFGVLAPHVHLPDGPKARVSRR